MFYLTKSVPINAIFLHLFLSVTIGVEMAANPAVIFLDEPARRRRGEKCPSGVFSPLLGNFPYLQIL